MYHWQIQYQTTHLLSSLPRLRMAASETVDGPAYRLCGRFRSAETHCLFKYTLKGEGVFEDQNGAHLMTPGHGFLCEIADPRTAYYYPKNGSEPWAFAWVAFDGPAARAMVADIVKRYGAIFKIAPDAPELQRIFRMAASGDQTLDISPAWGARLVLDLLTALALGKEADSASQKKGSVLLRRAQEIVAASQTRNLNVTELAQRLHVSREHLTRHFQKELAITPHDFISRRKILGACHLLKETALNNKEIAARLGYLEAAHFSRTFKRLTHMTPTQFRLVGNIPVVDVNPWQPVPVRTAKIRRKLKESLKLCGF
jgi:AraC-like DNA-binding protein